MILAGDIGGTHARLAFFDAVNGHFSLVSASDFSQLVSGLDEIVAKFVDTANLHPDTACFVIVRRCAMARSSFQSSLDH